MNKQTSATNHNPSFVHPFVCATDAVTSMGWKRGFTTMAMTKVELSKKLGILLDPDTNRVELTAEVQEDIRQLVTSFTTQNQQQHTLGRAQKNLWLELLPWHSYN